MGLSKQHELYSGKAKSLYATTDDSLLIAVYRDDTTAFDGAKHEKLAHKGAVNNYISSYLMGVLDQHGVPTHFVEQLNDTETVVKKLQMIPVENVIRNIAAGSLCRRLGVKHGTELNPPLYELFYKDDALHDPLINEDHVLSFGWATREQLSRMRELTTTINRVLREVFADVGLILVDAKYEFGLLDGHVVLGDEISPDSCRVWDQDTKEPLDKDRFRQEMGAVVESYQIIAERLGIHLPA